MRRLPVRHLALATTALVLAGSSAVPANAGSCTWLGGAGDWGNAALWSCAAVPGSGDAARIDGKTAVTSLVSITNGHNIGTLVLDSGDTLAINNGSLGVYGGAFTNNGTVAIGSGGQLIGANGTTSITGTGLITLSDVGAGGAYLYAYNGRTLSLGSGQTVSGTGYIGADQGIVVNDGVINANLVNGYALHLDAQGGSGGIGANNGVGTNGNSAFLNTGTVEATGGGTLVIQGGLYENQGAGKILASGAGSSVELTNDVRIVGGTLASANGGAINAVSNGTQYLQDVAIGSGATLNVANDAVRVDNTLSNAGTIAIGSGGQLVGETATSSIGGGTVTLTDVGAGGAYLYNYNGTQMTLAAGTTVRGSGYVGNDQGVLINKGTINANLTGAYALNLDAQGGSGGIGTGNGVGTSSNAAFLNTGLLEATAGGTLAFRSGLYENQGTGAILASGANSVVSLGNDVRILGGTISATGGGAIDAVNSGTQYLQNVTIGAGTPVSIVSDTVRIDTLLTNNGLITIGNNGQLIGEGGGNVDLTGSGTVALNDTGNGGAYLYSFNGTQLTIGGAQTVSGTGYVGADQGIVVNNGVIDATAGSIGLNLDAQGGSGGIGAGNGIGTAKNGAFLNNNLIEATGGGSLILRSGLYENSANGRILATGNGSQLVLTNDVRVLGGTIAATNGGSVSANNSGTQYLQDVTIAAGTPVAITSDAVRIDGTLTNNGTITLNGNGTLVGETASVNLTGTGSVVLNDTGNGAATLYDFNGTQMTIGAKQTVIGTGSVGADQGVIVNNGVIDATAGSIGLNLDAQGGSNGIGANNGVGTNGNSAFLNNNLVEATGGGALILRGGLYENGANGQILATGSGSQVVLTNDVRVLGGTIAAGNGGAVNAISNGTQYLQDVTIGSGTPFAIASDAVRIDGTLTNNGTITIGGGGVLIGETASANLNGTGTVVLNDTGNGAATLYDFNGTQLTIGAGQTVRGTGSIGADQGVIVNAGRILADGAITIDAQGGNGGLGGSGAGTGGNAAFFNDNGGQVAAGNGGATLTLAGGLYEQAAGGTFSVGTGSSFTMANDASLANLKTGGVLDKGLYSAFAGGTMDLRSNQTGSVVTIGTNHAGTDTVVTLSGAGSVIEVTPTGGGATTTIDQSLTTIARSGELVLENGRSFTAANGGFANAGTLRLDSGASFAAPGSLANSGTVVGNGTVGSPITNSGSVIADGGTLYSRAITGTSGLVQSNAGATLSLAGASGPSTAGFLANNGTLALGSNNITVTSDYTNASFGSGNAFNAHANVTGSGLILAASATMDLSGPGLSGNTLNVGNVRLGGSSSTTLTITNNGTLTTLRGAVQSPASNTVAISSNAFVVGPNGGSTTVNLSYTGTSAGQLSGNTLSVVNNFDNVADRTLTITGAAYNPAAASLSPSPIDLGATRVGGTLSGTVTIANTAPVGAYSEKLAVNGATGSGGATGTAPAGLINPGSSAGSTVSIGTGTSGNYKGSVTYALATDGTGTSGLAQAALPSQTVSVTGRVYQTAGAQLATNNVVFATVRQGSTAPTATVTVTNTATGALTDNLDTSIASLPAGVTGSAPGSLAGGASGNLSFSENTASAGQFGGTATIGFTSTDAELAPLSLPSQNVQFSGTVTQLATAQLLQDGGVGTFAGGGQSYTLDLGSFMAGSGSASADLGVLNGNAGLAFSETLGGMFGSSGGTGFTFAGMTFSGLQGGDVDHGNLLTFNYGGLGAGTYTDTLTFNGFSRYAGLGDYLLGPITVKVTATITGGGTGGGGGTPGAVPEPATWTMLILGFGAIAGSLRRERRRRLAAG